MQSKVLDFPFFEKDWDAGLKHFVESTCAEGVQERPSERTKTTLFVVKPAGKFVCPDLYPVMSPLDNWGRLQRQWEGSLENNRRASSRFMHPSGCKQDLVEGLHPYRASPITWQENSQPIS
ncbi:MAG: hypothetical protein GX626_05390 [Spirochaetales bacterium]|jgi:hypothetical protein|nr:hypothetical protein [Spirochaetales bacterium]